MHPSPQTSTTLDLQKKEIGPFEVQCAMIGIEIVGDDNELLNYVKFLAGKFPIRSAHFLHVVPEIQFVSIILQRDTPSQIEEFVLSKNLSEIMEDQIRKVFPAGSGTKLSFDVRKGNPLEELLSDAQEVNADLIIIGQKKTSDSMGIMAKKLARKVECNALIVPEGSRLSIQNILVPIDFSANSAKALQQAISITETLANSATITCLHIYELPDFASYNILRSKERILRMIQEDRKEAFAHFLKQYGPSDKKTVKTAIIKKDMPHTSRYIMDYADEINADLIVMGAKGHSKVELMLLGSVTEKVLTINKSIPTYVVK